MNTCPTCKDPSFRDECHACWQIRTVVTANPERARALLEQLAGKPDRPPGYRIITARGGWAWMHHGALELAAVVPISKRKVIVGWDARVSFGDTSNWTQKTTEAVAVEWVLQQLRDQGNVLNALSAHNPLQE